MTTAKNMDLENLKLADQSYSVPLQIRSRGKQSKIKTSNLDLKKFQSNAIETDPMDNITINYDSPRKLVKTIDMLEE